MRPQLVNYIFLVICIPLLSFGQTQLKDLKTLIAEYIALPKNVNEEFYKSILDNVMLSDALSDPNHILENRDLRENLSHNELLIDKKQELLNEIYKQSVLEINGSNSYQKLNSLLFYGIPPISGFEGIYLPDISTLSRIDHVAELLTLLMQREPEVKTLALQILLVKGPVYPSTDSFARGLSRHAALLSGDETKFAKILDLYGNLHNVLDAHNATLSANDLSDFRVGRISNELPIPSYNPSLNVPAQKEKIISNLIAQIDKRSGSLKNDLLKSLLSIPEDSRVNDYLRDILDRSVDWGELQAALSSAALKNDKSISQIIFKNLDRFDKLAMVNAQGSHYLMEMAVQTLISPYTRYETSETNSTELNGKFLTEILFHPSPAVRQAAKYGLGWKGFSNQEIHQHIHRLLRDPEPLVRISTIDFFWSYSFKGNLMEFIPELEIISKDDKEKDVRDFSLRTIKQINEDRIAYCKRSLRRSSM